MELLLKGVISGIIVVAATEVGRRSTVGGAILVSLPLVSMLALSFLWLETRSLDKVVDLSWAIALIVLPSIVFFVALPGLVRIGLGFWPAMLGATATMVAAYAGYAAVMARFGFRL